jgi:hypothetical protein
MKIGPIEKWAPISNSWSMKGLAFGDAYWVVILKPQVLCPEARNSLSSSSPYIYLSHDDDTSKHKGIGALTRWWPSPTLSRLLHMYSLFIALHSWVFVPTIMNM